MKAHNFSIRSVALASALALAMLAQHAYATAFTITSQLTGDPRADNPDNLIVDVTITGDDTSNTVSWLIDINSSPAHPGIKLDAFYFNMDGLASIYSFSNFSPADWTVTSPGNNASGSGSANFTFVADKDQGNATDVTNSVNLTFDMTKSTGFFLTTDFTDALDAVSSDTVLGSGQLGAHLQSLTTGGNCGDSTNCSDSGFAFGDYTVEGVGPPLNVPEPGLLFLMGAGLLGFGMARRRKSA